MYLTMLSVDCPLYLSKCAWLTFADNLSSCIQPLRASNNVMIKLCSENCASYILGHKITVTSSWWVNAKCWLCNSARISIEITIENVSHERALWFFMIMLRCHCHLFMIFIMIGAVPRSASWLCLLFMVSVLIWSLWIEDQSFSHWKVQMKQVMTCYPSLLSMICFFKQISALGYH